MGVKDVYNQLNAQEAQKAINRDVEEQRRKYAENSERKKREHDGEWRKQVVLLKELQEQGVIGLIEEFTGERMEIVERDGKELVGYDSDDVLLDSLVDGVYTDPDPYWRWRVAEPHLSDEGVWNPALRIHIGLVRDPVYQGFEESVVLAYDPTKELEIAGREIVFRGVLPSDPQTRTSLVEYKLAEALVNPIPRQGVFARLYPRVSVPS